MQSLQAYATAVETVMEHVTTAEQMKIRWIFADGQRLERRAKLHEATQSLNDVYDAASHLRDITGITFALDGKMAMVDAKLAYRSLADVPALTTFKESAAAEIARATSRASIVAAMAPTSSAAERAPLRALIGRAIAGDDLARTELRDSILAGVTSDRVVRAPGAEADRAVDWDADAAIADELVTRVLGAGDAAAADELLHRATTGWSSGVAASMLDQTVTNPNDARALIGAARRELDGFDDSSPAVRTLIASTRDLVDVNAQRLRSNAGMNLGTGYLDHPDYAELGRVQASIRLLRSFEALRHAPPAASTPPVPVAAASQVETLTW
ncbi:MAG: hypothetical protein JWL76_298 [Thermoleophilia bacterium]|nr:hypothetical protein [Thermoleophilia bacterium]